MDRTYLQVGFTVNSIESGATFEVRVRDGDGNYRVVNPDLAAEVDATLE